MSQGSDAKPLTGLRVVVTRAAEQARELVQLFEQQGATVMLLPAVSFEPVEDPELDRSIAALGDFSWLILASQNALRFFCDRCAALNVDVAQSKCRIAAVGPATARAAMERGLLVEWMPPEFNARALAEGIGARLAGRRVLLPRSDRARPELPDALRAAGARVTEVIAYRTVMPPAPEAALDTLRKEGADIITFASPSAVHHAIEMFGDAGFGSMKLAAIGPTTAAALAEIGTPAAILAPESTAAGLVAAVVEYVRRSRTAQQSSTVRTAQR